MAPEGEVKTVRVRISGRVQGVWFRAWAAETAQRLDLRGWVHNRRDGSVEAVFSGAVASVDAMIAACYEGPSRARVSAVRVTPADDEADALGSVFAYRPTL